MDLQNDLINAYIISCETRGLSKHSTRAYKTDLLSLYSWKRARLSQKENAKNLIESWLDALSHRGRSQRTIKRKIASVKSYNIWLTNKGLNGSDLSKLPSIKLTRSLPRNLNKEELRRLFSLEVDSNSSYRLILSKVIIEVLFQTGMRVGELCSLSFDDLDRSNWSFRVMGKGMRERKVYLVAKESIDLMKLYLKMKKYNRSHNAMFVGNRGQSVYTDGVRRLVSAYAKSQGIARRVTPHMLRHSAATELLSFGADIRSVQKLLGHSSLAITEIYTHVSDESLIATLKRSNPRASMK